MIAEFGTLGVNERTAVPATFSWTGASSEIDVVTSGLPAFVKKPFTVTVGLRPRTAMAHVKVCDCDPLVTVSVNGVLGNGDCGVPKMVFLSSTNPGGSRLVPLSEKTNWPLPPVAVKGAL